MFRDLPPDGNPSRTMKDKDMELIHQTIFIKNGVFYYILNGRHHRNVVTTVLKHSDTKFEWEREYIRVLRVFRRDEKITNACSIIKLSQLSNAATS